MRAYHIGSVCGGELRGSKVRLYETDRRGEGVERAVLSHRGRVSLMLVFLELQLQGSMDASPC